MVVPLLSSIILSLTDYRFGFINNEINFAGLLNYKKLFMDTTALKAIVNTLTFSGGALLGMFLFGTIISLLLFSLNQTVSRWIRPIVSMPLLISPIVIGLIWRYIYDPQGILYWILGHFGISIEQFPGVTGASTALLSTIIVHCWQVIPFVVIVITAGLVSIPTELYEASAIDGVNTWRQFWHITLPLLQDVYMVILIVSGVDTIMIFDIIFALTGGGPNNSTLSISIYAFNQGFVMCNFSYAMVLSVVTVILSFMIFGVPFIKQNLVGAKNK